MPKKQRRPRLDPDRTQNPAVTVPHKIFGSLSFNDDFELLGKYIFWCTNAVWRKSPVFPTVLCEPDDLKALLLDGFVVERDGRLFLTGPDRDPNWLCEVKRTWHTYAIEAVGQGLIKIGHTIDVMRRLDQLQCASPHRLHLLGSVERDIEDELHTRLRVHRRSGEWFYLTDDVEAALREVGIIGGSRE